jgi:hypothetical protein
MGKERADLTTGAFRQPSHYVLRPELLCAGRCIRKPMPGFGSGGSGFPFTPVRSLPVSPPRGPITSYSPDRGAGVPGGRTDFLLIFKHLLWRPSELNRSPRGICQPDWPCYHGQGRWRLGVPLPSRQMRVYHGTYDFCNGTYEFSGDIFWSAGKIDRNCSYYPQIWVRSTTSAG